MALVSRKNLSQLEQHCFCNQEDQITWLPAHCKYSHILHICTATPPPSWKRCLCARPQRQRHFEQRPGQQQLCSPCTRDAWKTRWTLLGRRSEHMPNGVTLITESVESAETSESALMQYVMCLCAVKRHVIIVLHRRFMDVSPLCQIVLDIFPPRRLAPR